MDILKRTLAPITDEAWKMLDAEAARTLRGNLSARKVVDFCGPHGWELAAVNLGTLNPVETTSVKGVNCGLRQSLPLVEIRVPFTLNIWDLDNITRGAKTPELESVQKAAHQAALFEETLVYKGFEPGGVKGILAATPNTAVKLPTEAGKLPGAIEAAIVRIEENGIGGPFALVLGTRAYQALMAGEECGYPVRKRVENMVAAGILWSPALEGGLLLSKRGGDFELTCGHDLAIGYHQANTKTVELYITESLTFQVIEPAAAVALTLP